MQFRLAIDKRKQTKMLSSLTFEVYCIYTKIIIIITIDLLNFSRPTVCDYSLLGCSWHGPFHSLSSHGVDCEDSTKNGLDLIDIIRTQKLAHEEEKRCLDAVIDLLSLNQIGVTGK